MQPIDRINMPGGQTPPALEMSLGRVKRVLERLSSSGGDVAMQVMNQKTSYLQRVQQFADMMKGAPGLSRSFIANKAVQLTDREKAQQTRLAERQQATQAKRAEKKQAAKVTIAKDVYLDAKNAVKQAEKVYDDLVEDERKAWNDAGTKKNVNYDADYAKAKAFEPRKQAAMKKVEEARRKRDELRGAWRGAVSGAQSLPDVGAKVMDNGVQYEHLGDNKWRRAG